MRAPLAAIAGSVSPRAVLKRFRSRVIYERYARRQAIGKSLELSHGSGRPPAARAGPQPRSKTNVGRPPVLRMRGCESVAVVVRRSGTRYHFSFRFRSV